MSSRGNSNYESFLKSTCPLVRAHYYTQAVGSPSSSAVASGDEAVEVKRPRIVLSDIWSALDDWSCFGVGVPLSLENVDDVVTQYYAPTLSAMQIFTVKPFADDSSSSGSSSTETGSSNNPNPFSNYRHRFLPPDDLGYLYFQYNEALRPFERDTLTSKITELAKQYDGLNSLKSSDLTRYSWISIAWYPIYQIPSVKSKKELSASFLTYHYLLPDFPETLVEDANGNGNPSTRLPPFGVTSYKAFGNVWNMPGTSDLKSRDVHEKSATSWLQTLGFFHSDCNFFMSRQFFGQPRWSDAAGSGISLPLSFTAV